MFKEYLDKLVATRNNGVGRIVGYDYIDGSLIMEVPKGIGWTTNIFRGVVYLDGYKRPKDKSLLFISVNNIIKVIKEEK